MLSTVLSFLTIISDWGLAWATVQKGRITAEEINTLFWTGALLGLGAWIGCIVVAKPIAAFYQTPELAPLCRVLGVSLFLNGLAIQPIALLKRQMRQREVATCQTLSMALSSFFSVCLAAAGSRYWALGAQIVMNSVLLLSLSIGFARYRPGFPHFSWEALSLLRFGGYLGACNVLSYFQLSLDAILVGHFCGATELGFYSRAIYLRTLPASFAAATLTDVMVPALSAVRTDIVRLGNLYIKTLRLMAFVGCPLAAWLAVAAPEVIRLLYGPSWEPVVPLFIILSFPALILPLTQSMGWLFVASGSVRAMFTLSAATLPLVALLLYIGSRWGTIGVAVSMALLFSVPLPLLTAYYAHRGAGLSLRVSLSSLAPIISSTTVSTMAMLGVGWLFDSAQVSWPLVLVAKLSTGAVCYAILSSALVRPLPIARLEIISQAIRRRFLPCFQ